MRSCWLDVHDHSIRINNTQLQICCCQGLEGKQSTEGMRGLWKDLEHLFLSTYWDGISILGPKTALLNRPRPLRPPEPEGLCVYLCVCMGSTDEVQKIITDRQEASKGKITKRVS